MIGRTKKKDVHQPTKRRKNVATKGAKEERREQGKRKALDGWEEGRALPDNADMDEDVNQNEGEGKRQHLHRLVSWCHVSAHTTALSIHFVNELKSCVLKFHCLFVAQTILICRRVAYRYLSSLTTMTQRQQQRVERNLARSARLDYGVHWC